MPRYSSLLHKTVKYVYALTYFWSYLMQCNAILLVNAVLFMGNTKTDVCV